MRSFKQLAAVIRRAAEVAKRALRDAERSTGGFAGRAGRWAPVPEYERVLARRPAQPRFKPPQSFHRYYSTQPVAQRLVEQLARRRAPIHAVFFRPQVSTPKPHTLLRRFYSTRLKFPTIPLQLKLSGVADLDLTPRVLLSSTRLDTDSVAGLVDSIRGQIAHLEAVARDVCKLATLGELPISLQGHRLRVHFENRSEDEVEALVREAGLSRAVVRSEQRLVDDVPDQHVPWLEAHVSPALSETETLSTLSESWVR